MVMGAVQQLLKDTNWPELDVLILDLPPGTGDAQLTLAQKVRLDGAVIITTPHDLALIDAKKGLKMFQKMNVAILGIIENMASITCDSCGHTQHPFGETDMASACKTLNVPFLGSVPLTIELRKDYLKTNTVMATICQKLLQPAYQLTQ